MIWGGDRPPFATPLMEKVQNVMKTMSEKAQNMAKIDFAFIRCNQEALN